MRERSGRGAEFEASRSLQAEAGYGFGFGFGFGFGGRFTGTPNAGLELADGRVRDYRIGWRLTLTSAVPATRREPAGGNDAEHG